MQAEQMHARTLTAKHTQSAFGQLHYVKRTLFCTHALLYTLFGSHWPFDLFVAKIVNKMQRKEVRNVGRAKYSPLT